MSNFWESSPEWQRKEELFDELNKATAAKDEAGQVVLASLLMGFLDTESGQRDRADYLTAYDDYRDAYVAWEAARKAFKASPAGQAKAAYFARLRADPIARETALATEEAAA